MAKRKLPKGIREKNGAYEARAMVNGIKINMYSANLDKYGVGVSSVNSVQLCRARSSPVLRLSL